MPVCTVFAMHVAAQVRGAAAALSAVCGARQPLGSSTCIGETFWDEHHHGYSMCVCVCMCTLVGCVAGGTASLSLLNVVVH